MLRFVTIGLLICFIVFPVYRFLKRRVFSLFVELENDTPNIDERLKELKQKRNNLKTDCITEEKAANKRARNAQKIKNKI